VSSAIIRPVSVRPIGSRGSLPPMPALPADPRAQKLEECSSSIGKGNLALWGGRGGGDIIRRGDASEMESVDGDEVIKT